MGDEAGAGPPRGVTRRALLGAGAAVGVVAAGALAVRGVVERFVAPGQRSGKVILLSTQLTPAAEAEAMRTRILAGFPGAVEFVPTVDEPAFLARITTEAAAGAGTVGVLGGQHGIFATLQAQGLLTDLRDLAQELQDRQFIPDYLVLARFRGEALAYIPWMQTSYIMVANREALAYLPPGLDETTLRTSLTYDQLAAWAERIAGAVGPKFGLPAGNEIPATIATPPAPATPVTPEGLLHRFLQGYAYPSFTRGVNSTFASAAAVPIWQWLRGIWRFANPASTTYAAMQTPLLTGDVWIAWDHAARLIDALRQRPTDFITFPAPRGPAGLGYMPAIAGLAIPKNAPDPAAARSLIEYLTRPAVQATTAREVSFFPTIEAPLPGELPAGTQQEAEALNATLASDGTIPSLIPVGLGDQSRPYNQVFRDAFTRIVIAGEEILTVLAEEAVALQAVLDTAQAPCWAPDPRSEGVCQVG